MNWDYYKKFIRCKNTKLRYDITPIFENPKVFGNLIKDMVKPFNRDNFNKIVALDALGFIIGSAIAYNLKKPLILIRKKGKFPYSKEFLFSDSFIDYTKSNKAFEIKKDSLKKGDKVLIVDEWIDTGSQIKSAVRLIRRTGAKISGVSTLNINFKRNNESFISKYNIKSINPRK